MNKPIADQQQRSDALDITRSFIVQAPAGSGKTSLLTQRFLALLAHVQQPEEIVAITFTRKAAGEMRNRILEALDSALKPEPEPEHEKITWQLASAALLQDSKQLWNLRKNPNRLRVQTIDSFCASLTRQLPLQSSMGGQLHISENPKMLYQEAARSTLLHLEENNDWSDAIANLLADLDNNFDNVERLIAEMLATRDQWHRRLIGHDSDAQRYALETGMQQLVVAHLVQLLDLVPHEILLKLFDFARFAASNLSIENPQSPLLACLDMPNMFDCEAQEKDIWLGLAELVLTKETKHAVVRSPKGVTKSIGFPTGKPYAEQKKAFQAFLIEIEEYADFISELHAARLLPAISYTDSQWLRLESLNKVLLLALTELKVTFSQHGEIDFTEIMLRTLQALGEEDNPTDLALMLDYSISHLLIDEFQDTSYGQYELLKKLTAGWQVDDGRTLFCVGDPMQSIYRFREADVGLFLKSKERNRIGQIALESLTLSANFRSSETVIDWVNTIFAQTFPTREQSILGAVTYAPSDAVHQAHSHDMVQFHVQAGRDEEHEAELVCEQIRRVQQHNEDSSIAILVRSRNHLHQILIHLRQSGLRFQAVEAEQLSHHQIIQDLKALTHALLHPADKIAWLSVLRAPWCGLELNDLLQISEVAGKQPLSIAINNTQLLNNLSTHAQGRITNLQKILKDAEKLRPRLTPAQLVHSTWFQLGGVALLDDAVQLDAANLFFDTLDSCTQHGELSSFRELEDALEKLFAPPDPLADGRLQVMTMHKAKGLEFDCVILPGLGRKPRNNLPPLLHWSNYPDDAEEEQLLMAPISSTGEANEPISKYISHLEKQKQEYEDQRLIYVAATRAKSQLHLYGHASFPKNNDQPRPEPNSLLNRLWPAVKHHFEILEKPSEELIEDANWTPPQLKRVAADWQPELPAPHVWPQLHQKEQQLTVESPEFLWAGTSALHIGTLVHQYLEWIAQEGLPNWSQQRLQDSESQIRHCLTMLGVSEDELGKAATRTLTALSNTLNDEKGRWILADHQDARSEYALTVRDNNELRRLVIDRTFIDEDGIRWIIDYKTGYHLGVNKEKFLQQEVERYQEQLQSYADAMQILDNRQTRTALYFPLMQIFQAVG